MPVLILLGAAGGALRGVLDAYTRFLDWQADRRACRQLPAGQENKPPSFQEYFDPVADPIAAVVHSAMGAGTAVLFGTTGQVSGAYAAFVVGLSAPVILTQLGRVQSASAVGTESPQTPPGAGAETSQSVPPIDSPTSAETRAHISPPMTPEVPETVEQLRSTQRTVRNPERAETTSQMSSGRPAHPAHEADYGEPRLAPRRVLGEEGTTR
ncbi:hypothetical protein [Streptomyces sp. HUCO-GS316]|uniref:hypothetical protein n=1 Tax=Streptomyces sp. HUCO-GS316 TaxID=2692198 RepID=UPI0019274E9B|nr:hypothetical protein [Streptomyces sp. HUCO-GS316]